MNKEKNIPVIIKAISTIIFLEYIFFIGISGMVLLEFFASLLFFGGAASAYSLRYELLSNFGQILIGIVSLILFILSIFGFFNSFSLRKGVDSNKLWSVICLILTSLSFFILVVFLFENEIEFLIFSSYLFLIINVLTSLYLIFNQFISSKK